MTKKLTVAKIEAANPQNTTKPIWCNDPIGFGIRINKGGSKAFIFRYRMEASRLSVTQTETIGRYKNKSGKGVWSLPEARKKAKDLLELVRQGKNPKELKKARLNEHTVESLCKEYIEKGMGHKKPSTIKTDIGRINAHIIPLLGNKKITELKRMHIRDFLDNVRDGATASIVKTKLRGVSRITGGAGTATRTTRLLGGILSYAVERDYLQHNVVHGVPKFPDKKMQNMMTKDDVERLGQALENSSANPMAIKILQILYFTGLRRGEVEKLKWAQISIENATISLDDSKTGAKELMINSIVVDMLGNIEKHDNSEYVFPAVKGTGYYQGTPKVWRKIRTEAKIPKIRIHDLRHNFASSMASNGMTALMIKNVMKHSQLSSTERYTHIYSDPQREATDQTGNILLDRLKPSPPFTPT